LWGCALHPFPTLKASQIQRHSNDTQTVLLIDKANGCDTRCNKNTHKHMFEQTKQKGREGVHAAETQNTVEVCKYSVYY
jgi:hypothetical protein